MTTATLKSRSLNVSIINITNNTDQIQTEITTNCIKPLTTIYAVTTSVLALCIILGNILLLTVIKKYPIVRGPSNKYLLTVHLSVTHLILSVVLLTYPVETAFINNKLSEVRQALVITLLISNGATLFLFACKRLFVNCLPFVYYVKKIHENTILTILLIFTWTIAIIAGCSSMFTQQNSKNDTKMEMISNWSGLSVHTYSKTACVILFFTFSLICICFHSIMYIMLRRRNHSLGLTVNRIPRPTIVTIVKTVLFIACWAPYIGVLLRQGTSDMLCCWCSYALLGGFLDAAFSWLSHFVLDRKYRKSLNSLIDLIKRKLKWPYKAHLSSMPQHDFVSINNV